jgi:hypothetical protein
MARIEHKTHNTYLFLKIRKSLKTKEIVKNDKGNYILTFIVLKSHWLFPLNLSHALQAKMKEFWNAK